MSLAGKLTVLVAISVIALQLTASTALAQHEEVQVLHEPDGHACAPCYFLVEGTQETTITAHVFGHEIPQSNCDYTLEAEIFDGGEGSVDDTEISSVGGAGCIKEPCLNVSWPFHIEERELDAELMNITICVANHDGSNPITCSFIINVRNEGNHQREFDLGDRTCSNSVPPVFVEIDGHWQSSESWDHESLEIVH